jgi:hypothetical protein
METSIIHKLLFGPFYRLIDNIKMGIKGYKLNKLLLNFAAMRVVQLSLDDELPG